MVCFPFKEMEDLPRLTKKIAITFFALVLTVWTFLVGIRLRYLYILDMRFLNMSSHDYYGFESINSGLTSGLGRGADDGVLRWSGAASTGDYQKLLNLVVFLDHMNVTHIQKNVDKDGNITFWQNNGTSKLAFDTTYRYQDGDILQSELLLISKYLNNHMSTNSSGQNRNEHYFEKLSLADLLHKSDHDRLEHEDMNFVLFANMSKTNLPTMSPKSVKEQNRTDSKISQFRNSSKSVPTQKSVLQRSDK